MDKNRVWRCVAAAGITAVAIAVPLQGQSDVDVQLRAGVALPVGDLADYTEVGPSLGVNVDIALTNRLGIVVDADGDYQRGAEFPGGDTEEMPGMYFVRSLVGIGVSLLPSTASPWKLRPWVGVGGTLLDTENFFQVGAPRFRGSDVTEFYFGAGGGVEVGYEINESITAYLGGEFHWLSMDVEETQRLADLNPGLPLLESALSVPITLGVRLRR